MEQYHSQNGVCFYTDKEMVCKVGEGKNRDSLSIDKIIPEKGYVKGNVVFCLNRINMAKNDLSLEEIQKWMPEWYSRIEKFLGNH
jgi:CRISPR/Cas system Type II protein with McrA/HNH and RuvC-like nuclease domain